ncbi:MAG: UDP-N-acetylmuramoyl-L-alanyl-D-glutamate--2,6-diaminopimelate ligase [Pseudomonadota bacterium]
MAQAATLADVLSLCADVEAVVPAADPARLTIAAVSDDSRAIAPGALFIAVAGAASDGHSYITAAIEAGAVAVLCERGPAGSTATPPVYRVGELAQLRSAIAELVYGNPSGVLKMIGITGTNGKTSTAHFAAQLGNAVGLPTGYVGTIGSGIPPRLDHTEHTTPSATRMPALLRELIDGGASVAALEVSSHALDQGRVDAVEFDVAVLTNLSRDHLDYHGTEANYEAAKRRLFEHPKLRYRVLNQDDPVGQRWLARFPSSLRSQTLGFGQTAAGASLRWTELEFRSGGIAGYWHWQNERLPFELPLLGAFAVENVAAAMLALKCLEPALELRELVAAGRDLVGVPGRMETFGGNGRPMVIVDYAHTPDALEKALTAARRHAPGRLWAVFGCGGDRDQGKRPQMGAVAASLADAVVVTSDNPRSEVPEAIIAEIVPALAGHGDWRQQVDRAQAIRTTLDAAAPEDVVLVAGKGHEDYQEINGQRLAFDDRAVVRDWLGGNG